MSTSNLEGIRSNRCGMYSLTRDMMAIDDCCKIINLYFEQMFSLVTLGSLENKSLSVSLIFHYIHNIGTLSISMKTMDSITPTY